MSTTNRRYRSALSIQLRRAAGLVVVITSLSAFVLPGAAATQPVTQPVMQLQVRDLKTLSLHDRLALPDQTKVTIYGKTFTLGVLRHNHAALVASRNNVRSISFANLQSLAGANHAYTKVYKSVGPVHHIGPIWATPPPSTVPRVAAANGVPYPADYQQFCGSVPATVCLYYPSGVSWYGMDQHGNYQTIDTLVTDAGVCSQEGGQMGQGLYVYGCFYSYPSAQTVNFVPPPGGFTESGWCDPNSGYFSVAADTAHGALQISDAGASGFQSSGWPGVSGGTHAELFCFLQVKLTH